MRFFLDTNVIVYALDRGAPTKRQQAIEWLSELAARGAIVISPQVVNEAANVFIGRLKADIPAIRAAIRGIAAWCVAPAGPALADQALQVRERFGFDWWDCLLIAAALAVPCDHLLTEDLQDGQNLGGLHVVNPFQHPARTFLAQP